MKTTSKYQNLNISATTNWIILNFKLKLRRPNNILQILKMKSSSNGRWPQNIKSGISQQLLIGSYSNFKLQLRWPNHILKILKIRQPQVERWPQSMQNVTYKFWGGNLEENTEEISSVALLSAACLYSKVIRIILGHRKIIPLILHGTTPSCTPW